MVIPLRILFVGDSVENVRASVRELRRGGYEAEHELVKTAYAMSRALKKQSWDIVISDYDPGGFSGLEALALLKRSGLDLPFVVISGHTGEDIAVEVMRAGAHDYILKGNLSRLVSAVERELNEAEGRKERRRIEDAIQRLAFYDALTELPNRTLLRDRLQRAVLATPHHERPVALLLMDLDRFKDINNTLGHHVGDLLLQQVGMRLREVVKEPGIVARAGGDEFALLLLGSDREGAIAAARGMLGALDRPFLLDGLSLNIRGSIGIAICPDHGEDGNTLMRRADVAMYVAKQHGQGFALYSPEVDQYSPRRLRLVADMDGALVRRELFLHYQPKVSLSTRRMIGVEALARWEHPELGLVGPDEFIPLGEHAGWIRSFTLWGIEEALRQCALWRGMGLEVIVAVNLSVRNLQDVNLTEKVVELLESSGVTAPWLDLEITESDVMSDAEHAMKVLTRLSEIGVRVTIDDFGTGYTSLSYLKKIPADEIKIDKSFILNMAVDEDDAAIVRSTIDLGHNLGFKVSAEGVEDQETMDRLVALGCDAVQGFFLSPPVSAADLLQWSRQSPCG